MFQEKVPKCLFYSLSNVEVSFEDIILGSGNVRYVSESNVYLED